MFGAQYWPGADCCVAGGSLYHDARSGWLLWWPVWRWGRAHQAHTHDTRTQLTGNGRLLLLLMYKKIQWTCVKERSARYCSFGVCSLLLLTGKELDKTIPSNQIWSHLIRLACSGLAKGIFTTLAMCSTDLISFLNQKSGGKINFLGLYFLTLCWLPPGEWEIPADPMVCWCDCPPRNDESEARKDFSGH